MKAALYLRVSTDRQAREGLSLEAQEARCREAAERAGATQIHVFRDEGETGKHLDRAQFQALLSRIGEFDQVWTWDLDRITRESLDWPTFEAACRRHRVKVNTLSSPVNLESAAGRFLARVTVDAAQYTREGMLEKVLESLAHRADVLELPSCPPPFGYRVASNREPWRIEPDEAAWIRHLYEAYLSGVTLGQLTREMNGAKVRGRRGGTTWYPGEVRRFLRAPHYTGRFVFHGEVRQGHHEPIVSQELWDKVQARLDSNAGVHPKSRSRSMSALYRCGVCGGFIGRYPNVRRTRMYYRCSARLLLPRDDRHPRVSVRSPEADEAIWEHTKHLLGGTLQSSLEAAVVRQEQAAGNGQGEGLRRALAEVELRLSRVSEGFETGVYTAEYAKERTTPLLAERVRLQGELDGLVPNVASKTLLAEIANVDPERLVAELRGGPMDMQLAFLRTLYSRVAVQKKLLVVHHTSDLDPHEISL